MRHLSGNEFVRETIGLSGRALRAAGRHRPDAAVGLHVLVRRCAGQVHRRDLFGRPIAVAARLRGARRAVADGMAASRRVHAAGTAVAAIAPGRALDPRGRGVLSRHRLSAARRRHHLLSGLSDLRHRAVGDRAARACRLAALERCPDRLLRRADCAAALVADGELAGDDRARRQPVVCGADADHPFAAGDAGYRAGVGAVRRHLPARRGCFHRSAGSRRGSAVSVCSPQPAASR